MRVRRGGRWGAPSNVALLVVAILSATVLVYDFKLSNIHESIRVASLVAIDIPGNIWSPSSSTGAEGSTRALFDREKEQEGGHSRAHSSAERGQKSDDGCDCSSVREAADCPPTPPYLACPPVPDCPKPTECPACPKTQACTEQSQGRKAEQQSSCGYWRLPGYEMLQQEHRQSKDVKGLLVLTLSGGWGNHYHNIARAFAVAVAMDRAFIFDVPEEAKEGMHASIQPSYIDWRPWGRIRASSASHKRIIIDAKDTLDSMLEQAAGADVLELGHLENNWFDLRTDTFHPSVTAALLTRGLDVRALAEPCLFDYLVRPTAGVELAIQQHMVALRPTPESKYVAIHIRTGKGEGTRPWFIQGSSVLQHLTTVVSAALAGAGLPTDSKWLLATDDPDLGVALRDRHPEHIVLSNTELSLTSGLHINNAELGFSKDGAMLAFVDWFLLARSDALIRVGASSFSWTAAEYGRKQCSTRPAVEGGGILTAEGEQAEILLCV